MKGIWYVADIGSWERGRMFIFKEKNDKAALRRAFQQVKGDAPRYAGDVVLRLFMRSLVGGMYGISLVLGCRS